MIVEHNYEAYYKIKKGDIVVDAGATEGGFGIPIAERIGPEGIILYIDPFPGNAEAIRAYKSAHSLPNLKVIEKALWDSKGKHRLYGEDIYVYSLVYAHTNFIEVECDTLDNILKELGIDKIDLLKADVEGAELEMLRGARETLSKGANVAIAAYHGRPTLDWDPPTYSEVKKFLEGLGYEIYPDPEKTNMIYGCKTTSRKVPFSDIGPKKRKIVILGWTNPDFSSPEWQIKELLEERGHEVIWINRADPHFYLFDPDVILQLAFHQYETLGVEIRGFYDVPMGIVWTGTKEDFREEYKPLVKEGFYFHMTWTKWGSERLEQYYGVKFYVNPLGVARYLVEDIEPKEEREGFVYIGGKYGHKRIPLLLQMFNGTPHHLTLVGDDVNYLKSFLKGLNVNVEFTGYLKYHREVFEVLGRTKALVHASNMEGFNLTVPEALYMNCYCILYDLPVYHELYEDLLDEAVFLWKTEQEFKELLDMVSDMPNPETRGWILEKKLTMKDHVERIEKILEEII